MFGFFTRNDTVIFFVAFCIGILFVCVTEDKPDIIVRWPTPDNVGLIKYVDRANNCYEYVSKEVECSDNAKHIPIQNGEGMNNKHSNINVSDTLSRYQGQMIVSKKKHWEESFV